MEKMKVLFVCERNPVKSLMAQAYLNALGALRFHAESAGLEPAAADPCVVRVMKEDGIDISSCRTKSVEEIRSRGGNFDFVVAVCGTGARWKALELPGKVYRIHWHFPDPEKFEGSEEDVLRKTRELRDAVKVQVSDFVKDVFKYMVDLGSEKRVKKAHAGTLLKREK